jgi:D-psicose/D-tagatose/L-ribulose 3-epimerase
VELRFAAHNWMRPERLEVTLARLSQLGFEGIEIMGEPDKYEPRETRALLKKHNVRCWGSVSIMLQCRDLIHADKYLRIGSIEYLKDCITMVHELGGEVMCIVPSEVGKVAPMADPETEWAWAVEGLNRVADHARKHDVRIALEPLNRFETNFLNRHDQALCLANAIGDDIGVCLDAFHINIEEADPFHAIREVGDRLFDFHIADTNRRAPGEGAWDWKRLLQQLADINYTGCLTTEFVNPIDRSPLGGVRKESGTEGTAEELKFIRDHGSDLQDDATYTRSFEQTAAYLRQCAPQTVS